MCSVTALRARPTAAITASASTFRPSTACGRATDTLPRHDVARNDEGCLCGPGDLAAHLSGGFHANRRHAGILACSIAVEPHTANSDCSCWNHVVEPAACHMGPVAEVDAGQRGEGLEVRERRLVIPDALGGDDHVERLFERRTGLGEQILIAVG